MQEPDEDNTTWVVMEVEDAHKPRMKTSGFKLCVTVCPKCMLENIAYAVTHR